MNDGEARPFHVPTPHGISSKQYKRAVEFPSLYTWVLHAITLDTRAPFIHSVPLVYNGSSRMEPRHRKCTCRLEP